MQQEGGKAGRILLSVRRGHGASSGSLGLGFESNRQARQGSRFASDTSLTHAGVAIASRPFRGAQPRKTNKEIPLASWRLGVLGARFDDPSAQAGARSSTSTALAPSAAEPTTSHITA
jgi:hypothetical protein